MSICVTPKQFNSIHSSVTHCWYSLKILVLWKVLFCYPASQCRVFLSNIFSLIIWQNKYFKLHWIINNVSSGNAFAKVWRSSGWFFQGATPSCMRASWGWADFYLVVASRRNRTDSRPLNNCCFRAGRSSVVYCLPTSRLSQSSFSLFTGQWADILWKHWRCVLFLLA